MSMYSKEELDEALRIVSSAIDRCEKAQPKFAEGTAQHTLLTNRIKALYISRSLLLNEDIDATYTRKELSEAIRPVSSIIAKCEKARSKFGEGSPHHARFTRMINAMVLSKSLITDEIAKRE